MNINKLKSLITIIILAVVIFGSSALLAYDTAFSSYLVTELKVIEADPDAQTVLLESPDGETAALTAGDVIGSGEYEIIEIQALRIILESLPDDTGATITKIIPVIPIQSSKPVVVQ
ncbi:MAG: hypothetical protein ABFS05_09875 [Bacteroidota bacterium]